MRKREKKKQNSLPDDQSFHHIRNIFNRLYVFIGVRKLKLAATGVT